MGGVVFSNIIGINDGFAVHGGDLVASGQAGVGGGRVRHNFLNGDAATDNLRVLSEVELVIDELWHSHEGQDGKNDKSGEPVHQHAAEEDLSLAPEAGSAKSAFTSVRVGFAVHGAEAADREPVEAEDKGFLGLVPLGFGQAQPFFLAVFGSLLPFGIADPGDGARREADAKFVDLDAVLACQQEMTQLVDDNQGH